MLILRWILFIPVGVIAGVLASAAFRIGAFMFPDIIGFLVSGAAGATALVLTGLYVAPRKSAGVKWTMISLTVFLGVLSALGALLAGDDKLETAVGISMALCALGFWTTPLDNAPELKPE